MFKSTKIYKNKGEACAWCNDGNLVIRINRVENKKFLSCGRYPECKYTCEIN